MRATSLVILAALAVCLLGADASARDILPQSNVTLNGGGGSYHFRGKSMLDRRYRTVLRQKYDFSCGSAALATLLSFHYDRPIDEKQVIKKMFDVGDQERIKKEGFSLLDMKKYLESVGLESNGYKQSLDTLANVGIPAIVLINHRGYMHFVVVQGVKKDKILIGDPSLGTREMDRAEFEKQWNQILFVVMNEMPKAQGTFNTIAMWNSNKARWSNALSDMDLSRFALHTSYAPNLIF